MACCLIYRRIPSSSLTSSTYNVNHQQRQQHYNRRTGLAHLFNGIHVADILPGGGGGKHQFKNEPFENDDCNSMSSRLSSTTSSSTSAAKTTAKNKCIIAIKNHRNHAQPQQPLQLSNQMNTQQKLLWAQINRID